MKHFRLPPRIARRLRGAAAILLTAIAGYFSLATSCLDATYSYDAALILSFNDNDDSKLIRIRSLSQGITLYFSAPVLVPTVSETDAVLDPLPQLGGAPGLGGQSSSEISDDATFPLPNEDDPIGSCTDEDPDFSYACVLNPRNSPDPSANSGTAPLDMLVRVFRDEQVGAFQVMATATTQVRSCSGPPERMAIRIEELPE